MVKQIKNITYYPLFFMGYLLFNLTKKTPYLSYISLRKLYCITNGKTNELVSKFIQLFHPAKKITAANGVLGNLNSSNLNEIVGEIEKNGFYVFKDKLNESLSDELIKFAFEIPAILVPNPQKLPKTIYNGDHHLATKYQFEEADLLNLSVVQKLITDESIFAVAQNYLKSVPVNDSVTMWWSTDYVKKASSEAAQLYHFDMDRLKFIKFFIYLTDVNADNGPHCYIKGSHTHKPKELLRDNRISDSEILAGYSKENEIEIYGPKGTIIAVDTSGFHKGKPINKGVRLLFQIEFTNSLFGQHYNSLQINKSVSGDFQKKAELLKRTFQRISFQ
jgi:ectoine hydroxylase-related dioxygenase (phytanoyl-CoA dioxygenase family)